MADLILVSPDKLREIITDAVYAGIMKGNTNNHIALRPLQAASKLGVSYNTYRKILSVTGRDVIYSDEVELVMRLYEAKKSRKS